MSLVGQYRKLAITQLELVNILVTIKVLKFLQKNGAIRRYLSNATIWQWCRSCQRTEPRNLFWVPVSGPFG